jgi:nitrite reductase/ring-hydroxylating ferredoxin subunit
MEDETPFEHLAFEDVDIPETMDYQTVAPVRIPADAYTSPEYAQLENERLWGKVWQAVCRVEELREVGDYVTYDIMDESIIIVRTSPEDIKAYYNVCQHRGRRLTEGSGNARQFICGFHGWRWKITGENTFVNDRKGYGECLTDENTALEPVNAGTWGGWVWINMDPDCEPLIDWLQPAARLLGPYELDKMRYRWRQWLIFPCNWKTALEAFNESHHAAITHPQLSKWGGTTFYTCWADGKHAWHGPGVSQGPWVAGGKSVEAEGARIEAAYDARKAVADQLHAIMEGVNSCTTETFLKAADRLVDELPEGTPPGEVMAHLAQSAKAEDAKRGVIWPEIDPAHQLEAGHDWHIFPNSVILHGISFALCYRSRPNGTDPNSCIFEVYVLERYPEGEEPETEWVFVPDPADERWPEVLQQDFANMPEVQRGMKSRGFKGARPNPRQEVAVINFHKTLSEYIGLGKPEPIG